MGQEKRRPIGRVIEMARACGLVVGIKPDSDPPTLMLKSSPGVGEIPAWILLELYDRPLEGGEWLRREEKSKAMEREVEEVFPGSKVESRHIDEPGRLDG